jgi:hypothetical protein
MIALSMKDAFESLSLEYGGNIEVITAQHNAFTFPEADIVVVIIYRSNLIDWESIRKQAKCKRMITVRESYFPEADKCYVFNDHFTGQGRNSEFIPLPCNKKLMKYVEKEPNSILIDH